MTYLSHISQKLRNLITHHTLLLYTFLFLAIGISILPDLYRLSLTPADTTFPLIHNHPEDYWGYLSYMKMGYDGEWLVTQRVNHEHFAPQFVYTLFVILGKLARITNISLPWMYFFARILGGLFLGIACIRLIGKTFSKKSDQLVACFLVLFSTGFFTIAWQQNGLVIHQFLPFWTRFETIMRTTFLPHHTISTAFGILAILLLIRAIEHRAFSVAILSGILGFLSGMTYHGTMVNILGGLGIGILLSFRSNTIKRLLFALPFFGFSLLSLLYIVGLTHTTWPWTASASLGQQFSFSVSLFEYIGVLGIPFLLTLLGLPAIFSHLTLLQSFLLGWAVFPFLGIFFLSKVFPYGNMQYFEATSYIPLGILAVCGINMVQKLLFSSIHYGKLIILILLTALFLPPHVGSLQKEFTLLQPKFYNQFIPNDVIEGFTFLESYSPRASTVLAGGFFGSILPAFTHNYTIYGDENNTYNAVEKHDDLLIFFAQSNRNNSMHILEKYKVSYVLFSLDTDPPKEEFLAQLPLKEVFNNAAVTIFAVTPYPSGAK